MHSVPPQSHNLSIQLHSKAQSALRSKGKLLTVRPYKKRKQRHKVTITITQSKSKRTTKKDWTSTRLNPSRQTQAASLCPLSGMHSSIIWTPSWFWVSPCHWGMGGQLWQVKQAMLSFGCRSAILHLPHTHCLTGSTDILLQVGKCSLRCGRPKLGFPSSKVSSHLWKPYRRSQEQRVGVYWPKMSLG